MQMIRFSSLENAAYVGGIVPVILASPLAQAEPTARRLAQLGCIVDVVEEVYDAISLLTDDPRAARMLVVDCDAFGGAERCRRLLSLLGHGGQYLAKVLLSSDCQEQIIPVQAGKPYHLRAPLSAVALRVVMENAFGAQPHTADHCAPHINLPRALRATPAMASPRAHPPLSPQRPN